MKPGEELRALGLGTMLLLVSMSPARAIDDLETGDLNPTNVGAASTKKQDDGPSFVAMPIPMSNPTVGSGLGLIGAVLYQPAGANKPWGTGIGGLYTSTSSYAFGVGQRANFDGDKYRLEAGLGYGSFNLSFYGVGSALAQRGVAIPINQTGYGTQITGLARVFDNFYLGFNYQYLHLKTKVDLPNITSLPNIPDIELGGTVSALGYAVEYDTRNSDYYPTKGMLADLKTFYASDGLGSDFTFQTYKLTLNKYFSLNPKSVIAARLSICDASSGTPFFEICRFGSSNDLRGYESGRYRDHAMYAAQAEYRWRFAPRWGAVGFAGFGGVAPKLGDLGDSDFLPSAGLGLRFAAVPSYGVDASIDYAVGRDGNSAFYFYVGQSF